jgi:hypothetical protein
MRDYRFIIKPLFFIFNLLFATWLVFKIETISPSDFGRYKALFESKSPTSPALKTDNYGTSISDKKFLKNLFYSYHIGLIDSVELDQELDSFFKSPGKISVK